MPRWTFFERDSVRLALADFGGSGAPALLLHGLAGHAQEWSDTASWLTVDHHVFALDLRGHGRSERRPLDLSVQAIVADAVAAIQEIGEPVILGGQSLGGVVAILAAAAHPDRVRALVVVEASPVGLDAVASAALAAEIEDELSSWPLPFRTRDEAVAYFGGPSVSASAWVAGLEERQDGLWPGFDIDVMVRMIRETVGESQWAAWEQIPCPVLIVKGENGSLAVPDAREMKRRLPSARLVEIGGAGHDVHLDRPHAWRKALSPFLADLSRTNSV